MEMNSFNRRVGAGSDPLLGSDSSPTSPIRGAIPATYLSVPGNSGVRSVLLGYEYTGAGAAPSVDVEVYAYENDVGWWNVTTVTLEDGVLTLIPPRLAFVKEKGNTQGKPNTILAFVPIAAGGEPDGTYRFAFNPAFEAISSGGDGATETTLLALSAKLAVDADDAAPTVNPLIVAGVHRADPSLDPVDDGDVGQILITDERRVATESRAYDPVSNADKSLPVHSVPDDNYASELDDSLAADGTVTKYVRMGAFIRWSALYQYTAAAADVGTLTFAQSNDDTDDPTTAVFEDVTQIFFGKTGFTSDGWIEPELPTGCTWLRVQVTVSGWTAGTATWVLRLLKLAQG